jgi:hypothetical protein
MAEQRIQATGQEEKELELKKKEEQRQKIVNYKGVLGDVMEDAQVFLDGHDEPTVRIAEDELKRDYPVRHKRVKAWLRWWFMEHYETLVSKSDLEKVLEGLEMHAFQEAGYAPEEEGRIEGLINDYPVFAAMIKWTQFWPVGYEDRRPAVDWYNSLKGYARQYHAGGVKWPPRPSDLARFLNANRAAVERIGLKFTARTDGKKRFWSVKRLAKLTPDDATETTASRPKSKQEKEIRANDGREDMFDSAGVNRKVAEMEEREMQEQQEDQ